MSDDNFTEVTSESWFGRIGGAFKGIIVGLIMFVAAFPLLFWNEGNSVKTYKSLKEGSGVVVTVPVDKVDSGNEGKLVHVTGKASTEETLADPDFGVSAKALKLGRVAEMYQWTEKSESKTKKKMGGGTETETTYSYSKTWSEDVIDSGNFKKSEGHENPGEMAYRSSEVVAENATLGAFKLQSSEVSRIDAYRQLDVNDKKAIPSGLRKKAQLASNGVYIGKDPSSPQVGDIRISFREVPPTDISIVARQTGDTFSTYPTKAGKNIDLLNTGIHSSEAMFAQAQRSNTIFTWVLRVVGFLLMMIGLNLVFKPLSVLGDVIPILGDIIGAGTGIISLLISLALSSLTVAIAWIVYRPLLGITLLAVTAGAFVLVWKLKKGKGREQAKAPA